MRICIGEQNDKRIETNERLLQYNYRSRKNYSIDLATLEKRLTLNTSLRKGEPTIHNVSDLKVCYDR